MRGPERLQAEKPFRADPTNKTALSWGAQWRGPGPVLRLQAGRRRHGTTFASMVVAQAREATLRESQAARRNERR